MWDGCLVITIIPKYISQIIKINFFVFLDLSEKKPFTLPTFVETNHRHLHHLNSTGKHITDRVVYVLGFVCPDITFSPVIYSLTSLMLHFMPGSNNIIIYYI